MNRSRVWAGLSHPPDVENYAWQLFHENSKTGKFDSVLPDQAVRARMQELYQVWPFDRRPEIELPKPVDDSDMSVLTAIRERETARSISPAELSLQQVSTLLHAGYGVTRSNIDTLYPRPFRAVPSGGALYPLEIFFHINRVSGLDAGLYHYDPLTHRISFLKEGNQTRELAAALVQQEIALNASMLIFIVAIFGRSTFKYNDRGYRFVLIEAGHVGQNLSLAAASLGLGCVNIGGYFDREIDNYLGLDGIEQSAVYLAAIGNK